jgi:GT2 family glycosyltransferase
LISIIVPIADGRPDVLADTVESLGKQDYARWELVVVCEPWAAPVFRQLLDGFGKVPMQAVWTVEAEHGNPPSVARGASASLGEFVWFVRNGDRLAARALSAVVAVLNERADTDVIYCDEDLALPDGSGAVPFFKPSWSPELLLSLNYLSYATVYRRSMLLDMLKSNEPNNDLSPYDCILWAAERTNKIVHIPNVLYHSRQSGEERPQGGDGVFLCSQCDKSSLERALRRKGVPGFVEEVGLRQFRIRYRLSRSPLVSIIIPTKDRESFLSRCLSSIERRTSYSPYEIIVLDNGSVSQSACRHLAEVGRRWRVLSCPGPFNFSLLNNQGGAQARGEYLLFLNDDTEVIATDWLTIMLEQGTRPGVGVVGAKLLYPDGRIQHGGVVLGVRGVAGHAFRHTANDGWGYHGFAHLTRNCSAVTAACMLVSRTVFEEVGGFDAGFPVEFNDVDLCLRIRKKGYRVVYAPDAMLYHHESATRRGTRCPADEARAVQVWGDLIRQGDPYYHPCLTRHREDWSLDI